MTLVGRRESQQTDAHTDMNHLPFIHSTKRIATIAVCACLALHARPISAAQPSPTVSGGQLLQEVAPPLARPKEKSPSITIKRSTTAAAAGGEAFYVRHIEVKGNSIVSRRDIRHIVAPFEGKQLTLGELQGIANRITATYVQKGYPFTQGYVPAQTIRNGLVRIDVLEAHYDRIKLDNKSRVRDSVVKAALSGLQPGAPVGQASLDRALLLASDLPSTSVKGVLMPGRTTGASQLLVNVAPGAAANSIVGIDDYGNAATGRVRFGATVAYYNPLELGDTVTASALTAGRGMNYERLSYAVPVHGPATEIEAGISRLDYKIVNGSESSLRALGMAEIGDIGLQRMLVRSTDMNVRASLSYAMTRLRDEIDAANIHTDRHTGDWHAGLGAEIHDRLGVTTLDGQMTLGRVVFDDQSAAVIDGSSARTAGGFTKFLFSASRMERLGLRDSLLFNLAYQAADKNLDVSEQLFVGGPSSVRAYDNGVASGSQGSSETVEYRHDLPASAAGHWQLNAFIDHTQIQMQARRYSSDINIADVSGAGVGLTWASDGGWSLVSALAAPLGSTPSIAGHRDTVRLWGRIQKSF